MATCSISFHVKLCSIPTQQCHIATAAVFMPAGDAHVSWFHLQLAVRGLQGNTANIYIQRCVHEDIERGDKWNRFRPKAVDIYSSFVQECKDAFENGWDRPLWRESWRLQPLLQSMALFTILLRGDKLADSPTVTPTMLANTLVYKEKFQTTFFTRFKWRLCSKKDTYKYNLKLYEHLQMFSAK